MTIQEVVSFVDKAVAGFECNREVRAQTEAAWAEIVGMIRSKVEADTPKPKKPKKN